ncbi:hypothetical protein ACHAWF_016839 [Thalassiosira exigua]
MTSSSEESSSVPPILLGIRSALGPSLLSRMLRSKILLVGSGGIGCELLKNLALSGFRDVEVVDLDTIDVSNLNRQFLFRARHVGMPKCKVASEAALEMVPPHVGERDGGGGEAAARYVPLHGNVCDNAKFNVPYVRGFDLVLNALDNVVARRRVNRLCLAAAVPLVEAGTAGYLGQVTVIHRDSGTECYECQSKPVQKVYPICTIRSTPSQPVHCIVWAKELYKLIFGAEAGNSMLFEDEESLRADVDAADKEKEGAGEEDESGNAKEDGDEKKDDGEGATNGESGGSGEEDGAGGGEKSTYMDAVTDLRSLLGVVPSDGPPTSDETALRAKSREALTALFATEIEKQIGMDRYKTAEKVPVPISAQDLGACVDSERKPPTAREGYAATDLWSPSDCVAELAACLVEVAQNASEPNPSAPLPEFDKDDDVAMRFVAAASNLRQKVFGIEPLQSLYGAKGIAGNIIPAIATTNAIAAGLQVLQAFHVLKARLDAEEAEAGGDEGDGEGGGRGDTLRETCRYTYCLRDKTRRGYLLQPTTIPEPNPNCFVCRNATVSLALDTRSWTLEMLLARVLKKELGFGAPTVMIGEDIVYEEGEDVDPSEYGVNLTKKLVDLPAGGAGHGAIVNVEDFTQNLEVEVSVSHKDVWTIKDEETGKEKPDDREEVEKFQIGGKMPVAGPAKGEGEAADSSEAAKEGEAKSQADEDSDDDIEVIDAEDAAADAKTPVQPSETNGNDSGRKRPPEEASDGGGETKRIKVSNGAKGNDEAEVVELD